MTPEERQERIALLILWTGWSAGAFEKMSDHELLDLYERRVGV